MFACWSLHLRTPCKSERCDSVWVFVTLVMLFICISRVFDSSCFAQYHCVVILRIICKGLRALVYHVYRGSHASGSLLRAVFLRMYSYFSLHSWSFVKEMLLFMNFCGVCLSHCFSEVPLARFWTRFDALSRQNHCNYHCFRTMPLLRKCLVSLILG